MLDTLSMAMRGARRAESPIAIDLHAFGWDRATMATLRHSTLPWFDSFAPEIALDATPLAALEDPGSRDRLSLLGQFAAHHAFLQFAGVRDDPFEPKQWAVVRKRGSDCRLVRVVAGSASDDAPPALTAIQQFASAVDAPPLDVLRRPWARADTAYQEIEARLHSDAAADLRWLRASACGWVASPGHEGLRTLLAQVNGRFRNSEDLCVESLKAAALAGERVVMFGESASPLERYSAVGSLRTLIGPLDGLSEQAVVERVLSAVARGRYSFVILRADSFDESSRRVVDLLLAADIGVWVGVDGPELPETSWFLLSPKLGARRELESRLATMPPRARKPWLEQFVQSPALSRYLEDGEMPVASADAFAGVREPLRSYVAAVALLGPRAPGSVAGRLLERLQSPARAADLLIENVTAMDGDDFVFVSDAVQRQAAESIPAASRPALCRVAAEVAQSCGESRRAAFLLAEAGDHSRAAQLLEATEWESADEAIRTLRRLPPSALSPSLGRRLAEALIECGRYSDARQVTTDELLLARVERRLGDYGPALARLDRLTTPGFESELLRSELLQLTDRQDEAAAVLDRCRPETDEQRIRLGYHSAVLRLDSGEMADDTWLEIDAPSHDYYAARIAVYRSVAARDLDAALENARKAAARARSIPEKIDATLDFLFVLFCSSSWAEARAAALDALLLVDETQGDRGAGGILFLLAYLAADDGQCGHATHLLDRLRKFYGDVHDEKRLIELDLLAAQIDFARGRFDSARREAEEILTAPVSDQIREAAALVADEIDWIERRDTPLRSTGATANIGLTDRHALLRARRGVKPSATLGAFSSALLAWEEGGGVPPAGQTGSEKLMLLRAALGRGRSDVAEALARDLKVVFDRLPEKSAEAELRVLRSASIAPFPFGKHDLGPAAWRYATRNRLGQWHEVGSLPALAGAELDRLLARNDEDWIACSDRELLYIAGLNAWSSESREAVASLFRVRAEHHRLQRIIEEEPPAAPRESVEGIVGESPAIRELCALIPRVARRDVPVCILGESGTGKELVARAIHRQSGRRHKPFTAINCAALPENLIESELFGHARGAFTGADRDRPGLIEMTDSGTLFLDEIGEMPLVVQAKLLRFLQEGEFRRVGETANRSADVRVVAATNRKLEAAVEQGRFREDLYYRIRGVEIVVAPLRDRGADIALLAAHFLSIERQKHRGGPSRLSAEVDAAFASYHWPGNVRELQNTIRAAHVLAGDAREIDLEHLPERLRGIKIVRTSLGSYQDAVVRFRRDLIERSLAQVNGNQNQAAAMLKISRQALAYQIRELGILVTRPKPPHV